MASEWMLGRDGVRLAGVDFGGDGAPALLLHGLAGHGDEWAETARWLPGRARVVAPDARAHGRSEQSPADVSRAAHVADAAFAVERLRLGPVVVVGQSLGGQIALLLTAQRPELVRGLVVADASPAGGADPEAAEAAIAEVGDWLRRWPVPFASRAAALEFLVAPSVAAEAWADGLEHRDGRWWPRFDADVMVRTLREAARYSYLHAWERIACPTLVVRAGNGIIAAADARAMADRGRHARLAELADAAHDLHLDRPTEWRITLTEFLDALDADPSDTG